MQQGVQSLHCIMHWGVRSMVFTEISLLPYTAERLDYLLHNAAEVKSYSCIMQQRVKSSQQGVRFGSG
jgi:hypothetical protein